MLTENDKININNKSERLWIVFYGFLSIIFFSLYEFFDSFDKLSWLKYFLYGPASVACFLAFPFKHKYTLFAQRTHCAKSGHRFILDNSNNKKAIYICADCFFHKRK